MNKLFSKIKKKKLLHVIFRAKNKNKNKRINVTASKEFLQFSYLNLNKKDKFLPHKHFWKKNQKNKRIVQESWLVIKGSAKIVLYDLNDKILSQKILKPGDLAITFEGGHKLEILKDNTIIYEHKTGPYEGRKKDLIYINS